MSTAEGIASRVRAALDAAGIAPAQFADELGRPVEFAGDILSGARPVSSLALAVAADLAGEDTDYLIAGKRSRFQFTGPCVMSGGD